MIVQHFLTFQIPGFLVKFITIYLEINLRKNFKLKFQEKGKLYFFE